MPLWTNADTVAGKPAIGGRAYNEEYKRQLFATVQGWASSQSWWGIATTIIVIANGITMTLRDKYAENIPILGKIWPILIWLSLNIANNKNEDK